MSIAELRSRSESLMIHINAGLPSTDELSSIHIPIHIRTDIPKLSLPKPLTHSTCFNPMADSLFPNQGIHPAIIGRRPRTQMMSTDNYEKIFESSSYPTTAHIFPFCHGQVQVQMDAMLAGNPGLPPELFLVHNGMMMVDEEVAIGSTQLWRDLDGQKVGFRSNHRPRARYLYFHYCCTINATEILDDGTGTKAPR